MSKSPSLRRIQADVRELSIEPSDRYHAAPLEHDMFEWHFTIRGADDTEFEGGVYHGRILLPAEYPFKPPNIVFLTPSGRFETNTKVCLSFSAFHPELWQPAWGIRLILEALISFLPTPGDGAIGALDWTKEERKKMAKKSLEFNCYICGSCSALLPKQDKNAKKSTSSNRFQKEIEKLHALQSAAENGKIKDQDDKEEKDQEEKKSILTEENDETKAEKKKESGSTPHHNQPEVNEVTEEHKTFVDNQTLAEDSKLVEPNLAEISNSDRNQEIQNKPKTSGQVLSEPNITEPSTVDQHNDVAQEQEGQTNDDLLPNTEQGDFLNSHWLSDPIIHSAMACLAIIVYILVRKVNDIMEEMRGLEAIYSQT